MKKNIYQQPTTEVVKLQQRSQILADSNTKKAQAALQNYMWFTIAEE